MAPEGGHRAVQSAAWRPYGWAVGACALTAVVASPLRHWLDQANTAMLFLLAVALVAVRLGRRPAVLAAVCSVVLFDFFFVPPHLSLRVDDLQYLVTFAVMLAVAMIISHLAAGLAWQADEAHRREARMGELYGLARELAGALSIEVLTDAIGKFLARNLSARLTLVLPDANDKLQPRSAAPHAVNVVDEIVARSVYERRQSVVMPSPDDPGTEAYLPLIGTTCARGVMMIRAASMEEGELAAQLPLLEAVASLAATALERLHFVDVAQTSNVQAASERLRSSILSALSHDIRTPLTALYGLADTLTLVRPPLSGTAQELALALRDQALRVNGMVSNLLDMARLRSGKLVPNKDWQSLEEVIGASIQLLGAAAKGRVDVKLPALLPLIEFDAVLLERVFGNLLENALKYSPPDSIVCVTANLHLDAVEVVVSNPGRGFPEGRLEQLFEPFERGLSESDEPGVGLGLAICRVIVEAHGGAIRARNLPGGGACVSFTLPRRAPPEIEPEPDESAGQEAAS